ncbi:MAG: MerR family DNA-binding transcriptional regulator, partial [Arcicella sp.]|nr:MerR family DNA-binding transcriptional regulator [Arcicella sp.]
MLSIKEASELLGAPTTTLRNWAKEGKITSVRTEGGHRRYQVQDLIGGKKEKMLT